MKTKVELEAPGRDETLVMAMDAKNRLVIDLHRDRGAVGIYLFSITLRILVETWFLYVLLFWNLPGLSDEPYECWTALCSQLHVCVVRAAPEKRMSIYALSSISGMNVISSVFFCIYAVAHYIFKL